MGKLHTTKPKPAGEIAALRMSAKDLARFHVFADAAGDWAWEIDRNSVFTFSGPNVENILGYTPEEVIGKTPYDFMLPAEADRIGAIVEAAIAAKEILRGVEAVHMHRNGREVYVEVSAVPMIAARGRFIGYRGICRNITKYKLAEAALAGSEKRFMVFMEHLPAGAYIKERSGRYLYVNGYMKKLFNWDDACVGKTSADLLPQHVAERIAEEDRRVLSEGPLLSDVHFVDSGGTERFIDVYKFPIRIEGALVGIGGVVSDVSARRRAEDALEKRMVALTQPLGGEDIAFEDLFNLDDLQRLQDMMANAWGVSALITRPDGTPITQPSNFCHLCGDLIRTNPKGVEKCRMSDAIIGRQNPSGPIIQACFSAGLCGAGASITIGGRHVANWLIGQVRNEMLTEEPILAFAREIGADEEEFRAAFREIPVMPQEDFDLIAQALFALANQLSSTAYQNIQQARFIADRKKAEEALRESEARFRSMVELSPLPSALTSLHAGFEYVNPMFTETFGYTLKDVSDPADWFNRAFPDATYRRTAVERWNQALEGAAGNGGRAGAEVALTCRDGSVRTVEIFRSRTGDKTLEVFIDVTERKRMEEERRKFDAQMRDVQKLESLGVLAGGIAHDFNNLLMAILGNADLALLSLSPVSPACQYVEEVTRASQRAADLCRQMLAYSGKGRFVVESNNVSEIVREMGQILEVSVSKKASIRYVLAQGLPPVESDATQMRQVIMNLITNASDAIGEENGIITVTTGVQECDEAYLTDSYVDDKLPEGTYVYVEVADTGHGMDAETRAKIFDPFFTTKFIGRGLGLAAVLGIVRGHKGAIRVYSEVGKGTTIKVLLPAVEPRPEGAAKAVRQTAPLPVGGTVLLVDDDATVRGVVSQMLRHLGLQVMTATNGREAVDTFKAHPEVACVILDLTMPEMGGEEAFRELRGIRNDVRVIMSSGYNEQDVTQRFAGRGLAGFIQKPFTTAKLRSALGTVLS